MLPVDLHCHSHFSLCGLHSIIEMLCAARDKGMKALAITDHGPELKGRAPSTFWDRLFDPVSGIRLLKGMECNLRGEEGEIDFPKQWLSHADVVLLGIHTNTRHDLGPEAYSRMLIKAMRKNPWIDILTHLDEAQYRIDFGTVLDEARHLGIVVELNNSKSALHRTDPAVTAELIDECKSRGCRIAVTSDAHALQEIGSDDAAAPLLARVNYPENLIVTRTAGSAFAFIDERHSQKKSFIMSDFG